MEAASQTVGPEAGRLWASIMSVFEGEASKISELANSLQTMGKRRLQTVLASGERDLRNESELDDNNWKQLCDAARAESRAEARYQQSKINHEKARGRVLSIDRTGSTDSADSDSTPSNRISQFGNMLGSGEAMKKLHEGARLALAKNNLNEADQKAAKEQQAFDTSRRKESRDEFWILNFVTSDIVSLHTIHQPSTLMSSVQRTKSNHWSSSFYEAATTAGIHRL